MPSAYDQEILPPQAVVDRSRPFIADSLTPLFYTSVWSELTGAQRLTYNQASGTYWNELISWFERELAMTALAALRRKRGLPAELVARIGEFIREEILHAAVFRQLNILSAPERYQESEMSIVRMPRTIGTALAGVASAGAVTALLWIMLLMEERSIAVMEISRLEPIDALYAHVYRAHAADESRHVVVDLELLDRLYATHSGAARLLNARVFEFLLRSFLVRPGPAARRTVDVWLAAHPELQSRRGRILRELRAVGDADGYRRMMYSSLTTPRTIARLRALPEMAGALKCLA